MTKFPGGRFKCLKELLEKQLKRMETFPKRIGVIGVGGGGVKIVQQLSQMEEDSHQRTKRFLLVDAEKIDYTDMVIGLENETKERLEPHTEQQLEIFAWKNDIIFICSTLGGETSRKLLALVVSFVRSISRAKVVAFVIYPFEQEADEIKSNANHTADELANKVDLIFRLDNDLFKEYFHLDEHSESDDKCRFNPYQGVNNEIIDVFRCFIQNSKENISFWNFGKSIKELKGLYKTKITRLYVSIESFRRFCVNQIINDIVVDRLKINFEKERIGGIILRLEVPVSFSILKIARLISDLKRNFDDEELVRLSVAYS